MRLVLWLLGHPLRYQLCAKRLAWPFHNNWYQFQHSSLLKKYSSTLKASTINTNLKRLLLQKLKRRRPLHIQINQLKQAVLSYLLFTVILHPAAKTQSIAHASLFPLLLGGMVLSSLTRSFSLAFQRLLSHWLHHHLSSSSLFHGMVVFPSLTVTQVLLRIQTH